MAEQFILRLSESEAMNLADFIEENLFDAIRTNTDIDNFYWLCDMTSAYKKLREAVNKDDKL